MQAPINSIKHYVHAENTPVGSATRRLVEVVDAVAAPSDAQDVEQGSIVKAIFLEFWVKSGATDGNDTKFQFLIEKVVADQAPVTFTQMNNLGSYPNKKNVLYFSQGVLGDATTGSIPIVRQWFKIPKGKQRFGLGDSLSVAISATGFDIDSCGFSTYKEYK